MAGREKEYRWYRTGCERMGQVPLDEAAFEARWQEYEDHAEKLKAAETKQSLSELEAERRAEMQHRLKSDPFVQAVLIGMKEDEFAR
ncbi:MAG TPA: hypothetical protein VKU00_29405 [Chthonomonadaceae bacterium]|nr:hypothetical protein [Chthonomonadaceae bacterium]